MRISFYTYPGCQFCAQAREYFKKHNISYEEKDIKEKREYLQELLDRSEGFSGVPFVYIEKDDATTASLKGFTESEYNEVFGFEEKADFKSEVPQDQTDSAQKLGEILQDLESKLDQDESKEDTGLQNQALQQNKVIQSQNQETTGQAVQTTQEEQKNVSLQEPDASVPVPPQTSSSPSVNDSFEQNSSATTNYEPADTQEDLQEKQQTGSDLPPIPDFPAK